MLALIAANPAVIFYLTITLAVLTIAGLGAVLYHISRGQATDTVVERLERIKTSDKAPSRKIDQHLEKTLSSLSKLTAPKEPKELPTLRKNLSYADYRGPNAAIYFFGLKTIGAMVCGGAALAYSLVNAQGLLHDLFFIGLGSALGLYGPNLWVRMRTTRRNDAMSKSLPNALDLLVVCVEAGLGLDMALKRVGEEIVYAAPELAKEMTLVSLEMNTGLPRQKALANLADRNSLDELRSLTTILVQAEKFGTSIAHALRVSADTIRTKRRQAAEERAAKTTVKLTFPLVLFILPAIFIVAIAPGVINFIANVWPELAK